MNRAIVKKIITGIALLGMTCYAQAKVTDEIEQSFDVDAAASLRIENINGSVVISSWDKNIIKVTALINADDQDERDNILVDITHNSKGVNIETKYKKQSTWGENHSSSSVSYNILVPINAKLSSIELVNGSLSIDNVKGEIKADLVNGSITASGLESDSEFNSVNGGIEITYKRVGDELKRIELDTVNGRIKLYLPQNISASIDAETMHGSISNDFDLKEDHNLFSGHSLKGNIGNGDIRISLESVNGSVKILKKS